jgi:hypothetical protein
MKLGFGCLRRDIMKHQTWIRTIKKHNGVNISIGNLKFENLDNIIQ